MSSGIKRAIIPPLCGMGREARDVLREIRREFNWDYEEHQSRKVRLKGVNAWIAYFLVVNITRNPVLYLYGIPASIVLYGFAFYSLLR